jgi:hypothetical protein
MSLSVSGGAEFSSPAPNRAQMIAYGRTLRVEAAHIDRRQAKRPNFIHLTHDLSDLFFTFLTNHALSVLRLVFFRKLEHDVLQHLIHSWNDFLWILDQLTVQLATRRERAQILAIQVKIRLARDANPPQIALVQQHFDGSRRSNRLGGQAKRAVVRNTVFRFETLDELPECLHRIGQVDRRPPNRANFVGLILRRLSGSGGQGSYGGRREREAVRIRGGEIGVVCWTGCTGGA